MRGRLLLLAVLALPAVAAADPSVVLVEEHEGWFVAPTTPFVGSPLAHEFVFDAPECYRNLALDLLYDPDEAAVSADGAGDAAIAYEFRAEVWRNGTLVLAARVDRSDFGSLLGLLDEPGEHTLRLSLGWGADVHYTLRLRGLFLANDPACNPPL